MISTRAPGGASLEQRRFQQMGRAGARGSSGGAAGAAAAGMPRSLRRVLLSSDLLGTEPLLAMVGEVFGQPLYVCPPERHREVNSGGNL